MFRALMTERELLPRLLEVEGLVEEARARAERYVAGRPVTVRRSVAWWCYRRVTR